MSGGTQAFLDELLPKRTDGEDKKSFIRNLLEWKEKFALHEIDGPKIVPFSTESSADKVFLTLVPLIASTGVTAPKFSEHEIASKNSILDKLESIPGLQTSLNTEEIKSQLSKIGAVILIVPESINSSFKRIYPSEEALSLKDPKKFLCAITTIILMGDVKGAVFDIKVAREALIKNVQDARNMDRSLKKICSQANIRTSCIVSHMNQPLGQAIGNSLEVIEALEILKERGPLDILKIALELGTEMLLLAEKVPHRFAAKKLLKNKIINGEALEKFKEIIQAQKGNARIIDDYSILPRAKEKITIASQKKGYVQNIRIDRIYFIGKELGVFRKRTGYPIDHGSGFLIHKKIGDWVEKNEILAEVYSNNIKDRSWIEKEFRKALAISQKPPDFRPFIIERN
jgi:pyrimidine-nucleoside phosphorylase